MILHGIFDLTNHPDQTVAVLQGKSGKITRHASGSAKCRRKLVRKWKQQGYNVTKPGFVTRVFNSGFMK